MDRALPVQVWIMSMSSRRSLGRRAAWSWIVALGLLGCTPAPRPREAEPEEVRPGTLRIELPVGVGVRVDGEDRGSSPVRIRLPAGEHAVVLRTACAEVERVETLVAGKTTTIDDAPGLGFATLKLRVEAHDGAEIRPRVFLDDVEVPVSPMLRVPACAGELRVEAEGRGAYHEEIDLSRAAGETITREIMLAPGSDVVRIHGGDFVLGPTESQVEEWTDEWGDLMHPQVPVKVEDFEIDRTEVTAAQWFECRKEGGCVRDLAKWMSTDGVPQGLRHLCNLDTGPVEPVLREGHGDHPMNCVARWEAEDYCRWVGRRLPTSVEWEYAFKGGRSAQAWPWGNESPTCDHGALSLDGCEVEATAPVCSHPKGNSAQGICDLHGNVSEYVDPVDVGNRGRDLIQFSCMGASWKYEIEGFRGVMCWGRPKQVVGVGFRCGRSVTEGEGR